MRNFIDLVESRFSVRNYNSDLLSEQDVSLIKRAISSAPTSKNRQPQVIYYITNLELIKKLENVCKCIFDSKNVFVICYDSEQEWINKRYDYRYGTGIIDASIIATYMMLQAFELNIGSCMVGMFDYRQIQEILGIKDNIIPILLLPMGYMTKNSVPIQMHFERKKVDDYFKQLK